MDRFTLHEGTLPSGFTLDYEASLFNLPAYLALSAETPPLSFYLIDDSTERVVAALHFHVQNEVAMSPLKAPFGSVEFSERLQPSALHHFLLSVEKRLREKGVREVNITNPPRAYAPGRLASLETILLNQGYRITTAELATCVPVESAPIEEQMTLSEQQRLRQGRRRLTSVREKPENLREVYDLVFRCYASKGYSVSINFETLEKMVRAFPDRYLLFAVRDGADMVGASVSVRVSKGVVYNFLINHEVKYNSLSPPLLLIDRIHDYCRENCVALFDLGTSAPGGTPKFSLLDFKLRVGGVPSSKFSFHKRIAL